jgi:apolipoprotein N-acyltransferase
LAVLSGALLALAFPKFGHPGFAWVGLVPWLVALTRVAGGAEPRGGGAFLLGLAMGAVYFAGTLYWIPDVLVTYGGLLHLVAVPVAGLFVAYLALFPALASWVTGRAVRTYGPMGLWVAPFAWVAVEWLRGWVFTGFPWVLLGSSQIAWLPIAQVSSLAGLWGLSALVAAANVAIAVLIQERRSSWRLPALVGTLICACAVWGGWRLRTPADALPGQSLRVGIVQGNVPQDQKWSPEFASEILARYLRLSREAAQQGAQLVVWPESATPFYFEENAAGGAAIRRLARETHTWLLFGSDQLERGATVRYYNSAFLLGPDGRTAGVYRKQRLVPFGEYVPLKQLLFFVAPLVEAVSDFSPGDDPGVLNLDGHHVSTAICYEVIFGGLVRDAVNGGTELLTTITNDAWYGRTSAPWQHFDQAAMRAIESGRYLVRAANTGISGVVDPFGRVLARRGLFETGILIQDVRWLTSRTLYSRIGDSFAWACAALTVLVIVRTRTTPFAFS